MIDIICDDIDKAIASEAYISALSLALTLPDWCGKAEYPNEQTTKRYKKWYSEYIGKYETYEGSEGLYLSEDIVYNLRNNLLHQGSLTCQNDKKKEIKIDKFTLLFNEDTFLGNTSSIYRDTKTGAPKYKEFEVNALNLIMKLKQCARAYYNDNKEKFDFLNIKIVK